jgi:hypothetical protein
LCHRDWMWVGVGQHGAPRSWGPRRRLLYLPMTQGFIVYIECPPSNP